ncbi:MAG: magnesium transporter CorA family protein, partial [Acidimicrobiales bacterium]
MDATISTSEGDRRRVGPDDVSNALEAGHFFWLDLTVDSEGGDQVTHLLRDEFKFHPLAVEDAEHFGQRPKYDDYDDFGHMVVYGAGDQGSAPQEVHVFVASDFVVTLHRGPCQSLDAVHRRIARHHLGSPGASAAASDAAGAGPAEGAGPAAGADARRPSMVVVYLVVDALTDSFFPVLSTFDDKIDDLETSILEHPTEAQLGEIFAMKRQLLGIRKVVGPQRDMFAAITSGVAVLPGMTEEGERYFRDLYDHLIRIADTVDSYRDLLSSVMDTHVSTVSNRLNVVMKQLT